MNQLRKSTLNPDVNEHEVNILPCFLLAAAIVGVALLLMAVFS